MVSVSDEQGNRIDTASMKQKLGIGSKFTQEQLMKHTDLISFKTEFINEIPLYEIIDSSIVRASNESKIILKRFSSKGFSIKKPSPCATLPDEPNVVLSYGIDVLSITFTHEKPLNRIITVYDNTSNLNDNNIKEILQ